MSSIQVEEPAEPGAGDDLLAGFACDLPFPTPGLAVARCSFDVGRYDDAAFGRYGLAMPDMLARAVPKRKAEYLAGRWCARAALRAAGSGAMPAEEPGERAPGWPGGFVGSISHGQGQAVAVVGPAGRFRWLGVDCERVLDADLLDQLAPMILADSEGAGSALPRAVFGTIAFSAKESLYKALNRPAGVEFGFRDCAVTGLGADTFRIELRRGIAEEAALPACYSGVFAVEDGVVYTLVAVPRPTRVAR